MRNTANILAIPKNPAPCVQTPEPARRLFCRHYDSCLNHAVSEGWNGFTCDACYAYEPIQWDHDEWKHDELTCTALLVRILEIGEIRRHLRLSV